MAIIHRKHTHSALIEIGAAWLTRQRYPVVLKELVTCCQEQPDVIGWNGGNTHLLEAKATRSDFLADRKKWFRQAYHRGMGTYRSYICPTGLIKPEELPEKWGLIYVDAKGKTRQIRRAELVESKSWRDEVRMLLSVIRRVLEPFQTGPKLSKFLHRYKETKNE